MAVLARELGSVEEPCWVPVYARLPTCCLPARPPWAGRYLHGTDRESRAQLESGIGNRRWGC